MKKLLYLFFCIFLSYSCFAINITWIGGVGKWTRASNWSPAQVPGPNDKAIINSGDAYLLNPTQDVGSIEIQAGSSLYIAQGIQLDVLGTTDTRSIENNGEINNYGTLRVLNGMSSFQTGIYNAGIFINRSAGTLVIDEKWRGFHNATGGYASNSGDLSITEITSVGLYNQGDFENFSDIEILDCQVGIFVENNASFYNEDLISINATNTGIYNRAVFTNVSGGMVEIGYYTGQGIQNTSTGIIENDGGIIQINSASVTYNLYNQGEVYNLNCGELHFNKDIANLANALIQNDAWLFSNSTSPHVSNSNATFINNGVIHDPEDAFIWAVLQNNGIIVKPISGPLYVNQSVSNALGLGSLNGFSVGYWVDPGINFKVGSYDDNNNEFTPNNHGVGLNEIAVQIDFGSCGSQYLSIPISGGIQYPPSPFAAPNGNQEGHMADSSLDLEVFPNPAKDLVTVTLPKGNESSSVYQIHLLDINGQKLDGRTIQAQIGTTTFNIRHYPPGLYTICILDKNGQRTIKKLVIE